MLNTSVMTLNGQIAGHLEEAASLLEAQGANPYRVDAYRRAAITVRGLREPLPALLDREGLEGLLRLPAIGDRLGLTIRDMLLTGRFPMLEHLGGEVDHVRLLQSVPGIGKIQAERLHHDLGLDTLEELETAAHDGRLANIAGMGPKRLAGIIASLAARLGRVRGEQYPGMFEAPVDELLDVDREYREAVQANRLAKIAPRRFNPTGEAWLPILHTERGNRHYTAMFSNTARAHKLGRNKDWVILHHDGAGHGSQYTVISSQHNALRGKRIVRGREAECQQYYTQAALLPA